MQSTTINLLTGEGAIAFTFLPALSAEQYKALSSLIRDIPRDESMPETIKAWASGAGLQVMIDGKPDRRA